MAERPDPQVTDVDRRLAAAITGSWDPGPRTWWETAEDRLADTIRYCRLILAGGGQHRADTGPAVAEQILERLGLSAEQVAELDEPHG
jgi:hypothetical protein